MFVYIFPFSLEKSYHFKVNNSLIENDEDESETVTFPLTNPMLFIVHESPKLL